MKTRYSCRPLSIHFIDNGKTIKKRKGISYKKALRLKAMIGFVTEMKFSGRVSFARLLFVGLQGRVSIDDIEFLKSHLHGGLLDVGSLITIFS